MKKIITLILLLLVSAMPAAFADYMCEVTQPATALFPETLYSPTPAVSTAIKRAPRALSEKQRLIIKRLSRLPMKFQKIEICT